MSFELPVDPDELKAIVKAHPTPFHMYDESMIRNRARELTAAMNQAGVPEFKNYFAVKALPNPSILKILISEGMGADCSSVAELAIAEMCGLHGEEIMFTSNNTLDAEFAYAAKLGAIINFDDITHVDRYLKNIGVPKVMSCRYNPGDISFDGINESIIGAPHEAKFGMPLDDMLDSYKKMQDAGVSKFGIHTMMLSNERDYTVHLKIASMLFDAAKQINQKLGIKFDFINLGGGIGVAYHPDYSDFDVVAYANGLTKLYDEMNMVALGEPKIVMENGRYITAEAGYVVTSVVNRKKTHKTFVGVDASMSDLMRPGMYSAYHHISVFNKAQDVDRTEEVDVTGSLCENNDKFAINRALPITAIGDILIIHTTGAHGHAMGFQYNGKLRHAEILLDTKGVAKLIRRAENLDDYFMTLTEKGVYHVSAN